MALRREEIRAKIEEVVARYEIEAFTVWSKRPPALKVSYGGEDWLISARSGMSARDLAFELGKLEILAKLIRRQAGLDKPARRPTLVRDTRQTDLEEFTARA